MVILWAAPAPSLISKLFKCIRDFVLMICCHQGGRYRRVLSIRELVLSIWG